MNVPLQAFAGSPACAKVEDACKAAGYLVKDLASTGKNLRKDCMKPLLDGKDVPNVKADAASIHACQSARPSGKVHRVLGHPKT